MSYIKQDESGGGGDTYNLLANQDGIDVNLNLDAAAGADSQVKLKAGSNITLTEAGTNSISIDAAGGSPGGANTQVQFNDGGAFGGDSAFTFDKTGSAERVTISANTSDKILDVQQQAATNTLAMQVRSSSSQGLKVNNTGIMGIGIDPASGFAIKTAQDIQILGDVQHLGSDALQDGSAGSPMFSRTSDKNTGTFFPGADQLGFSTGGSERLRFGSAGQIGLGGANYGVAGEVLTSNGPSSAPTWQAGGGGGASGYVQAVTNWPNFSTNVLVFLPASNPPLSYSSVTTGTITLSNDIQFCPWLFREDTTIKDIGFNCSSANPAEMCVYESNSDGFPTNKVTNSTATFSSPISGVNMATMAAGASGITFSANELYWCAITNTTTNQNISLRTHGQSGSVIGYPGFIFNRTTLQLISGTVNALPASIGTLSISAGFTAFMAFARKA